MESHGNIHGNDEKNGGWDSLKYSVEKKIMANPDSSTMVYSFMGVPEEYNFLVIIVYYLIGTPPPFKSRLGRKIQG